MYKYLLLILFLVSLAPVMGWEWDTHDYLCFEGFDCLAADTNEYQLKYSYVNYLFGSHLCINNAADCKARVVAKYYLKNYYLSNNTDYLNIALHLMQDSYCPEHWLTITNYGIEEDVDEYVRGNFTTKGITVNFINGNTLVVDKDYLNNVKQEINEFISVEPNINILLYELWFFRLEELTTYLVYFFIIILLLFIFYGFFKRKK